MASADMPSFAQSVVRDFLREKGYTDTLECLTNEMQAKGAAAPSVESWHEVSRSLGLPELLRKNNSPKGNKYLTIIEVLLQRLSDIIVAERKANAHVQVTVHERVPPPHANMSTSTNFSSAKMSQSLKEGVRTGQRPSLKDRKMRDRSAVALKTPSVSRAMVNASGSSSYAKLAAAPLSTLGAAQDDIKRKKILSKSKTAGALVPISSIFDDESDNGVRSTENWIPMEVRMRMIRDEINNAAFKEEEKYREQRRLKKWQTETTALELEKVKDKYSQKRRQFCSLCEQPYLALNLPMAVSYKAIMDQRATWGYTGVDSIMCKPPRCYDTVRVCIFCAQFFDSPQAQEAYRSTNSQKGRKKIAEFDEIGSNDLYEPVLALR